MLTCRCGDLLLPGIAAEEVLESLVGHEAGSNYYTNLKVPNFMDMLSIRSLLVQLLRNVEVGVLSWLHSI